jgi:putative FmdB family regulatory protein
MPIYEYRCNECGYKFEKLRMMSQADAPITCPSCGHGEARRMVSACACFTKSESGETSSVGGGGGCGGCAGGSCGTCGH